MAIEYVGGFTIAVAGTTSDVTTAFALTGGLAVTPAAGDLVIVAYSVGATADVALAIDTSGGSAYTLIGSELYQDDTFDSNFRVAYRFMPATPETDVRFTGGTGNAANAGAATVQAFRGVDPSTPLDVAAVTTGGTSSRVADPAAITPVTAGAWIYVAGAAAAGTGGTYTDAELTNFRARTSVGTNDGQVGSGYFEWTAGAFDPAAFTAGGTTTINDSWNAVTAALRPYVAPPPPPSTTAPYSGFQSAIMSN